MASEATITGCGKVYKTERGYMGHVHTCHSCMGAARLTTAETKLSQLRDQMEAQAEEHKRELETQSSKHRDRIDTMNNRFQQKLVDATLGAVTHGAKLMMSSSAYHHQMALDFIDLCKEQAALLPHGTPTIQIIKDASDSLSDTVADTNEDLSLRQQASALLMAQKDSSSSLYKAVNHALALLAPPAPAPAPAPKQTQTLKFILA